MEGVKSAKETKNRVGRPSVHNEEVVGKCAVIYANHYRRWYAREQRNKIMEPGDVQKIKDEILEKVKDENGRKMTTKYLNKLWATIRKRGVETKERMGPMRAVSVAETSDPDRKKTSLEVYCDDIVKDYSKMTAMDVSVRIKEKLSVQRWVTAFVNYEDGNMTARESELKTNEMTFVPVLFSCSPSTIQC